jgi:hypothetical protein
MSQAASRPSHPQSPPLTLRLGLGCFGENPDPIREGVRVALADCEEIVRAQEEGA